MICPSAVGGLRFHAALQTSLVLLDVLEGMFGVPLLTSEEQR